MKTPFTMHWYGARILAETGQRLAPTFGWFVKDANGTIVDYGLTEQDARDMINATLPDEYSHLGTRPFISSAFRS